MDFSGLSLGGSWSKRFKPFGLHSTLLINLLVFTTSFFSSMYYWKEVDTYFWEKL